MLGLYQVIWSTYGRDMIIVVMIHQNDIISFLQFIEYRVGSRFKWDGNGGLGILYDGVNDKVIWVDRKHIKVTICNACPVLANVVLSLLQ